MRRRTFLRSGGVGGVALLAGCLDAWSGGSDDDAPAGEGDPEGTQAPDVVETTEVRLTDSGFAPRNVQVDLGVPVTWENEDDFVHTVTAVDGSPDAELEAGETVQHAFEESRVYELYCRHHGGPGLSGMAMKVGVGNATIEDPLVQGREEY